MEMENRKKIEIDRYEDIVVVRLPIEFRNRIWGEDYGVVQKTMRNLGETVKDVVIDGSYLEWVDPIPMLSLLISMAEIHQKKRIIYVIPNLDYASDNQKRVCEFLEKEGFLSVMLKYRVHIIEIKEFDYHTKNTDEELTNFSVETIRKKTNEELTRISEESVRIIHEFKDYIFFKDCKIMEAKVVDLNLFDSENQLDNSIELELESIKHRISSFIKPSQLNDIIWKTEMFLKETINNVYEHAYENKSSKYVGYYMRHRIGLADNTLSQSSRTNIERAYDKESRDLKPLNDKFPRVTSNFLEIYVIDAGIGLTRHYTLYRKNVIKKFREVWRETIGLGQEDFELGQRNKDNDKRIESIGHVQTTSVYGQRGTGNKKNTCFGGLYTLGQLLKGEFLLGRDYEDWIGDVLPVEHKNASYLLACDKGEECYIEGLSLMSRLAILQPMDHKDWMLSSSCSDCFIEAMEEEKSIYEKYFNCRFGEMSFNLSYIKDNRFSNLLFMNNAGKKYLEQKENVKFCFFLPNENVSKNNIYNFITDIQLQAGISNESKSVIISDIPVNECGLYQQALEFARYKDDFIRKVDRIIMISQRLSVLVLVKERNTYQGSPEETEKYINFKPREFSPHLSLLHAIEWLKTHDSMLTWYYITKNNATEGFFVNKEIKWFPEDKNQLDEKKKKGIIEGYLDLEKTLMDSFLKKMYQNVLQRTLCLAKKNGGCTYIAEDPLMIGLTDYMNNLFYNKSSIGDNPLVALGSVYVSGSTQNPDAVYNINLFRHKDTSYYFGRKSVIHLLAWFEKKDFFLKDVQECKSSFDKDYKRVGSTYAIAPFGWRYFPIPRYKPIRKDGNTMGNIEDISNRFSFTHEEMKYVEFKQIYKCSPKETYNYWQGRNAVFLGISHVDYETKHDILNINFPFIVRESFHIGSDLACFLLGEIMAAFGLEVENVKFHDNQIKFRNDVDEYKNQVKTKYAPHKCSFLIYPYHSNTERIIDIIKDYIDKDVKFIPLIAINKERNGTSFLPSPLTIEMLNKTIYEQRQKKDGGIVEKEINALLFDDAIIDGKTQEEIKHVMYKLGVHHIMSLFILERRRIPFNTSDNRNTSVFWRLDIPRLGSKYSCPLCAAINSISVFSSQIVSKNARKRVQEWIDIWGARTENTMDRIQTLTPIKIKLDHPAKRFGIYMEDGECKQCCGESNKIELHNSLGLTLYMGELLSITPRDDKMLHYCPNIKKVEEQDKELDNIQEEEQKYELDKNLDKLALLEMLCTNLLLYGKTISRKVREKIVYHIFNSAYLVQECNSHTAFAALVLMTQENDDLTCLEEIYCKYLKDNKRPNYDMLILLSYLGQRNEKVFSNLEEPRKLRQTPMTEDKAYRLFHSELYNGNGKDHDRPIKRLIQNRLDPAPQYLRRAEDAMDCLKYALDNIHDWNLSDWGEENEAIKIDEEINNIDNVKNAIDNTNWGKYNPDEYNCIDKVIDLSNRLSRIHDKIYMPLNIISNNQNFKDVFKLKERIILWSKDYDIGFIQFDRKIVNSNNIFEKWMIWDRTVDDEMKFLLDNAKDHSKGSIRIFEEEHKIWFKLEYAEDLSTVSILIWNKTSPEINAEFIRQESAKKTRYGKTRLNEELKIQVDWMDMPNNEIQTTITFPLI